MSETSKFKEALLLPYLILCDTSLQIVAMTEPDVE